MSNTEISFRAADEAATDRLGQVLAEWMPPGTVVGLVGTLGAGKTRLVQAVAVGLGVSADNVTSPTFVLVNEYLSGQIPVYHFDTYRLRDDDEFLELGPDEYFDGQGITFVEWADRVADCLPKSYLRIKIEIVSETERDFIMDASCSTIGALLDSIRKVVGRL